MALNDADVAAHNMAVIHQENEDAESARAMAGSAAAGYAYITYPSRDPRPAPAPAPAPVSVPASILTTFDAQKELFGGQYNQSSSDCLGRLLVVLVR